MTKIETLQVFKIMWLTTGFSNECAGLYAGAHFFIKAIGEITMEDDVFR